MAVILLSHIEGELLHLWIFLCLSLPTNFVYRVLPFSICYHAVNTWQQLFIADWTEYVPIALNDFAKLRVQ